MYTLAIDDVVEVPVKFTLKAGKVNKLFSFTLTATRVPVDDIQEAMKAAELRYKEALISLDVFTGWDGQRLVLDGDGKPAEFSAEALDVMLTAPGVAQVVYIAYMKEIGAKEKN